MKESDKLRASWSDLEGELLFQYPLGHQTEGDARFLCSKLSGILGELEDRGYDTTTLRFSIGPREGHQKFASARENP